MDVVATAGHVDHGKSTLVRALTGMEPDRWAEERRRGMTIDLGFAWTTLPTGRTVAFVDVPGHQRFVANMLAGAGPVPAVLFVVAADEGWSRQSADHLAALDALGVRHGLIAVTKCDRADPAAAAGQARAELATTTLGDCPVVAVSGATGAGLDALRGALDELLAGLEPPVTEGRVRLWIDRSFTIRGSGTVVTGTLTAGTLRTGDELVVASTGEVARVRGLQSLGEVVDVATATARVAVNIRGVEPDSVGRGQALLTPESWLTVSEVDAELSGEAADLPTHVIAHLGSVAVPVRVRPLGGRFARLHLDTALPLTTGDRFVLRDPGAQAIVGGATAVDVLPPPLDRRGAAQARAATLSRRGAGHKLAAEVAERGHARADLLARAGASPDGSESDLVAAAGWWVSAARWSQWRSALEHAVQAATAADPLRPGMARSAAASAAGLPDDKLLDPLVAACHGLALDAFGVHAAGAPSLPPAVAGAVAALAQRLTAAPFRAPEADELSAAGLDAKALAAAVRAGLLVAVGSGVYLLPDAPDRAADLLARTGDPFTISEARQLLETSRRVAVPLLELLDRLGRTRRVDESHRIVVPR